MKRNFHHTYHIDITKSGKSDEFPINVEFVEFPINVDRRILVEITVFEKNAKKKKIFLVVFEISVNPLRYFDRRIVDKLDLRNINNIYIEVSHVERKFEYGREMRGIFKDRERKRSQTEGLEEICFEYDGKCYETFLK